MEITCTICNHYSRTQEQHERHVVTEEHKKNAAIYENGLEAGLYRAEQLADALETQAKAVETMFRDWDMARTIKVRAGEDEDVYRNGLDMYKAFENLDLANRATRAALKAYEAAK